MSGPPSSWLHCTSIDHGARWSAKRRAPWYRGKSEPDTPRLCVARSVAACLAAAYIDGDCHVYRTDLVRTNPPREVQDAILTGERWVVPPVCLTRVGIVERAALARYVEAMQRACASGSLGLKDRASILLLAGGLLVSRAPVGVPWITSHDRKMAEFVVAYFRKKEGEA